MVEIVGEDQSAKKRVTCRGCAAILEYTPSDTKEASHRDYTGCLDVWDYITCPKCNHDQKVRY